MIQQPHPTVDAYPDSQPIVAYRNYEKKTTVWTTTNIDAQGTNLYL